MTWEARHFGVRQRLTVRVTAFDRPKHFQDIMTSGAFKRMVHDHEFAEHPAGTLMRDRFEFQSPLGILGRIVDALFLTSYMELCLMINEEDHLRMQAFASGLELGRAHELADRLDSEMSGQAEFAYS